MIKIMKELFEYKKIIILGAPGSGKSFYSKRLSEIINIPVYHLDLIWWMEDKTHIERSEFDEKLDEILKKDEWIIDGDYSRTYEARIKNCDLIILLDYRKDVSINGVINRIGTNREDIPWIETEVDNELIKTIDNYKRVDRKKILDLINKYPDKEFIRLKTRNETNLFLDNIKK